MELLAHMMLFSHTTNYIYRCQNRYRGELYRVVCELLSVLRSDRGYLRLCLVEALFARGDARIFEDRRNSDT
jgi:hypothetical protein